MAFIEIDGANIYYETFGKREPGCIPVVLIHGSTGTGASNWSLVAPLLARRHFVIVPDCRGHGRSTNPRLSYSFKELADDTAALVRGLGFVRAHIVGHSNGGNVAVVVLLEHPEVTQTAVLQAANAYVSPDLVEKEPPLFDPDRVARENPAWMQEMIELHGEFQGQEYWRDLLHLTVEEIISEPNYTPEQLAGVQRPALVVQGENDRVNAPSRHAQFIAEHIPFSELWLPAGVGHTVHDERLFEWVERMEDFFARRGNDANDAIHRLKISRYADERETIFNVRAAEDGGVLQVSGQVLAPKQVQAVQAILPQAVTTDIKVLLDEDTPCALVNRSVHNLRRGPFGLAERVSQVLLGEAVDVLERRGDWAFVRTRHDGYPGWIPLSALQTCPAEEAAAYRREGTHLVQAGLAPAYHTAQARTGEEAGKLPFGVTLRVVEQQDGWSRVHLPDGRLWWAADGDLLPLAQRPRPDAAGIARTLDLLRRFIGVPYLWGGRSPFGFDCSGLAQAFWGFMGVQIPRDADQQRKAAAPVGGQAQPGDLLFFGENGSGGHRAISHVAISLGGNGMIHANGAAWGVSLNSLDPASPIYRAWLGENLVSIGRPAGVQS